MSGKFWLGTILLVALLAVGFWIAAAASQSHIPISRDLEEAANLALNGNFEDGSTLAQRAKTAWDDHWHATATVADHAPMEDIDGLFSQMEIYRKEKLSTEFAAYCSRISVLIKAISEAQTLNWWNLL